MILDTTKILLQHLRSLKTFFVKALHRNYGYSQEIVKPDRKKIMKRHFLGKYPHLQDRSVHRRCFWKTSRRRAIPIKTMTFLGSFHKSVRIKDLLTQASHGGSRVSKQIEVTTKIQILMSKNNLKRSKLSLNTFRCRSPTANLIRSYTML